MSQERRPFLEQPTDQLDSSAASTPKGEGGRILTSLPPPAPAPSADIVAKSLSKCFDLYVHDRDRVLEFLSRRPRHDEFWALRDLSFEVPRGCAYGIIGSNGAGKSTLLKLLSGVSKPTTGSLEINASISSLLDLGLGFHTSFTGRQNIYLNCTLMGLEREQIDALLPQILDFAELESFIDYPVKTYSSGMSLRLGFAIASHLEYQIFLIDEVLTVGDQYFQRKCVRKIEEFIEQGRTIVLVSHDLHAVRSLCDKVLWLKEGQIVLDGPAPEVVDAYVDAVRARDGAGRIQRSSETIRRPPAEQALPLKRSRPVPVEMPKEMPKEPEQAEMPKEPEQAEMPEGQTVESLDQSSSEVQASLPLFPPEPQLETPSAEFQPLLEGVDEGAQPSPDDLPASRAELAEKFLHGGPHSAPVRSRSTRGMAYRATTPDQALQQVVLNAVALDNAREVWQPGEAPVPMMEYHGDMPLVTGSGEARVLEVLFLNQRGDVRQTFSTGEAVIVAVTVKAVEPVEDPIFGVAIHRNDDLYVYGPNTQFDRCLKGTYHGLYTFFLHYPVLPLLTGTYLISVAVWDKYHLKPYAWHNRLYTLNFRADREDHGIIVLSHHWGVVTHVSGAGEDLKDPPLPAASSPSTKESES